LAFADKSLTAFKAMLKFFWNNLDRYKKLFIFMLVIAVLDGLAMFAVPTLLSEFLKNQLTLDRAKVLTGVLVLLYTLSLGLAWLTRRYGEALGSEFENYLRFKLYKRYLNLPYLTLKNYHSGYFLSLASKVATSFKIFINNAQWILVRGVTIIVFFLYVMSTESFPAALANTTILLVFIFFSTRFALNISYEQKELNLRYAAMMQVFADFLTNVFSIRQLDIQEFANNKILEKNANSKEQILVVQKLHAWKWFLLHGLYGLAFIGTIVFLLWKISTGQVSEAILVVLIGGFMHIRGSLGSLSEIIVMGLELRANISSLEAIVGTTTPAEIDLTPGKTFKFKHLSLESATFQYPDTNKVLKFPDFALSAGQIVCITGESGQGKTTILNILQGHLALTGGHVYLNQVSVSNLELQTLRGLFTQISQEAELFNLSLRDNLSLGKQIPDHILIQELSAVNLGAWFSGLHNGLDSILGEKGTKLSAGQKQRINLLRGVLQARQILLLDEPTSHLDADTEGVVVKYLKTKLKDRTAVIVTHRDALLELADVVIQIV
jgi:ABC-type multidrug transport system fused ATPase/permease subunit